MVNHESRKHEGDFDDWCDETRPHMLSVAEWAELMAIPTIQESWGLEPDETVENFAQQVYAAKFHFHSGSPGYIGDLFVLQGNVLTGDAPFVLFRGKDGKLDFAN